jgi:uncharacterized protein (UPF0335 family)
VAKQQVDVGSNEPSLVGLVDRIESLLEDRDQINEDIKEVYAEGKSLGYDTKIMRKVIARRRRDRKELEEEEAMIETYENALKAKLRKAGVEL